MQQDNLRVAAVQCDIIWENSTENVKRCVEFVKECDAELVILPEMVATGFSMSPDKIAQGVNDEAVTKLTSAAVEFKKAVVFSAAILDEGNYYNRLFFITPEGKLTTYNKVHLFRMAGEHNNYSAGNERVIIEYKGFRICPMICYDLRFPVFARNKNEYDVAIYIASWPAARSYAWSTLLRARAIENQCFVVGVNRVGTDPKNEYSGDTAILNYLGMPLSEATPSKQEVIYAELSKADLEEFRTGFPAHMDADNFTINW